MTTTSPTPSTTTLLLLKRAQIFWTAFSVNALVDTVLLIAAYGFGLISGYESKAVFNGSRLGVAMDYLFGGPKQFVWFVVVLIALGIATRWSI